MRLLGVYFIALSIIDVFAEGSRVVLFWRELTLIENDLFARAIGVAAARVASEFVIGMYLLLGGQWVFDRLLTPIALRRVDGSIEDSDDGGTN